MAYLSVLVLFSALTVLTAAPLSSNQLPAMAGGLCSAQIYTSVNRFNEHPVHCNRYLECVTGQDDSGVTLYLWALRQCSGTLKWDNRINQCVFAQGQCNNPAASDHRSLCTIGGDPHIRTFDNCWLHYQGNCTYVLARPKSSCTNLTADTLDFEIRAEHHNLPGSYAYSFLKYIHLSYKQVWYTLDPQRSAYVVRAGVTHLYTASALQVDGIKFFKINGELTATLPNGVAVSVRKAFEGKVRVPAVLQYCMEGFCGDYDGFCNAYVLKGGVTVAYDESNSNQMGNSWKTDQTCPDTTVPHVPQCNLNIWQNECNQVLASGTSSSSVFNPCRIANSYKTICKADICAHANNDTAIKETICETVRRAMSAECEHPDLDFGKLPPYCKYCKAGICQNGTCTEGLNTYKCNCSPGFEGKNCERETNECLSSPCINGGSCTDGVNSYRCRCPPGFTGRNCQTNINECSSNPCVNGRCIDGVNRYTCRCTPGYTGPNCETDINECSPNPCVHGRCMDGVNRYTCDCDPGYTGTNCDTDIDDCFPNPCLNGGSCTDGVDSYTCSCAPGFSGTQCEIDVDECSPSPCQNGGRCTDLVNDYRCHCVSGFSGKNCGTNDNNCFPDPCQNGGICTDGVDSYTCSCAPGFSGTECEINVDDCSPNPCQNGGSCTDGVNSYTCHCITGFSGITCQTNDNNCSPNPCQNGGSCTDGVDSYTCSCIPGFSGITCQTNDDNCSPNPCQNGGSCTDGVNSYTCSCAPGFSGINCRTNDNNCSPNPCQNGGTCTDGVNSYTCSCITGYSGINCETNEDNCSPNPCGNHGTCIDGVNSYRCHCITGYSGINCETDINDCSSNPCKNGGSCRDGVNSYACSCAPGFTGANCNININECSSNPCENGGTCIDGVNGYTCSCAPVFAGPHCETNTGGNCGCQNGGTCVERDGKPVCDCPHRYAGNSCEKDCNSEDATKSPCVDNSQPCQKDAECLCKGCNFDQIAAQIHYANKDNCASFLICQRTGTPGDYGYAATVMPCALDTTWSVEQHGCVSRLQQENPCTNGTYFANTQITTTTQATRQDQCVPGYRAHLRVCNKFWYIQCVHDEEWAIEQSCPKAHDGYLHFDDTINTCNFATLVNRQDCNETSCSLNHPCLEPDVIACLPRPSVWSTTCADISNVYYVENYQNNVYINDSVASYNGADNAVLYMYVLANVGPFDELKVEVSFSFSENAGKEQGVVANGDCNTPATFYLQLEPEAVEGVATGKYTLHGFIKDVDGKTVSIYVTGLTPDTRYNTVLAYSTRRQQLAIVLNGQIYSKDTSSLNTGPVDKTIARLSIGAHERDCDNGRHSYKGSIYGLRILDKFTLPAIAQ